VFLFAIAVDGHALSRNRTLSAETLQSIQSLAKTEQLDGEPVSGSSFGSGQPEIG